MAPITENYVKAKVFHVLDSVYRDGYDAFKLPLSEIMRDLPELDGELSDFSRLEMKDAIIQWKKFRIN